MNILLINQYYPPDDAPTGQYLHDLAKALVRRGHAVQVLCSSGKYGGGRRYISREIFEGIHITRLTSFSFGRKNLILKLADYITFYIYLAVQLIRIKTRFNISIIMTTPPWIGLVLRILSLKLKCDRIHWIMDLYPDVLFSSKIKIFNNIIMKTILRSITRQEFISAKSVIAIGPIMENLLYKYINNKNKVFCVPLWSPIKVNNNIERNDNLAFKMENGIDPNSLIFMYSGNMGVGHAMEELIAMIQSYINTKTAENITWVFSGGGKKSDFVRDAIRKTKSKYLMYIPAVDREGLYHRLSSADVHIASMMPGWEGVMIPSKIQAIFGVGRPTLFFGTRGSEAAKWIEESNSGWVVEAGDRQAFKKALSAAANLDTRITFGNNALRFSRNKFNAGVNLNRILEIIEQ